MTFPKITTSIILGVSTAFVAPVFGQQADQPAASARPNAQKQQQQQIRPQNPQQPQRPAAAQPGVQQQTTNFRGPAQVQVTEQMLATCLAIGNQEEVAIAQFATEKAKNEEVKEFAKMLVEDHQAFLKKLERFTPEAARNSLEQASSSQNSVQQANASESPRADADAKKQPAQAQRAQQQPRQQGQPGQQGQVIQQTAGQSNGQAIDLIQLEREIAQQCLSDSKKSLTEKDGMFDICFMGQQIAKHHAMKTKLTVLQRHASAEFAELIAEGTESTEKHLKQAEKIMEDLDKDDSKSERRAERKAERKAD